MKLENKKNWWELVSYNNADLHTADLSGADWLEPTHEEKEIAKTYCSKIGDSISLTIIKGRKNENK